MSTKQTLDQSGIYCEVAFEIENSDVSGIISIVSKIIYILFHGIVLLHVS